MFFSLFLKECKQNLKSLTYWLCVLFFVLFYMSQLGSVSGLYEEPQPGQSDYGMTYSTEEQTVMEETVLKLEMDYIRNRYVCYPLGFYKKTVLGDEKDAEMGKVILKLTGRTKRELTEAFDRCMSDEAAEFDVHLAEGLSYGAFMEAMGRADRLIGGHSTYSPAVLKNGVLVPQTYEGAMEEYRGVIGKDQYTGAFARLFCDYMGLMAAILPVFPAVARSLKDKRAKASQVIGSKQASSAVIILARYLAGLVMMVIPLFLMAGIFQLHCTAAVRGGELAMDHLAFLKYAGGWIFPSAAFAMAVGVFVSELTGGLWGILVQGLLWISGLFQSFGGLNGNFGLKMIPRFNDFGRTESFFAQLPDLICNRIFYLALSVILLLGTMALYGWKRRGGGVRLGKVR